MYMDFEKAVSFLGRFAPLLRRVPQCIREEVFDVRLSVHRPVMLCCRARILFLKNDGTVSAHASADCTQVTPADIEEIFLRLCGYSVYSHMDEIQSGFISAGRSLRVGIGGTAVLKNGALKTVRDVTSLSLRIPREIHGCADRLLQKGISLRGGLLLAGAPSSGKTTLLRDLARVLGTAGRRTVVLDERFELLADGFDLGTCTDVLQGYPKREGLSHALRCLSPEYILCDELGEIDFEAVKAAAFSGVSLIATVHAGSAQELSSRALCRQLLALGAFQTVALLSGRQNPAVCAEIFRAGDLLENSGGGSARGLRPERRAV